MIEKMGKQSPRSAERARLISRGDNLLAPWVILTAEHGVGTFKPALSNNSLASFEVPQHSVRAKSDSCADEFMVMG